MITTIIFDWGGVLTVGKWTEALIKILGEKSNKDLSDKYKLLDNIVVKLDTDSISAEQATKEINAIVDFEFTLEEIYSMFGNAINPNLETIGLLSKLKDKYKLLMLSDNDIITTKTLRKDHKELLSFFEKIYFSFEYKMKKPNKNFFELPLKELNLKPEECVFIDDKQKNIDAAEEIGMKGLLFENVIQLEKDLKTI